MADEPAVPLSSKELARRADEAIVRSHELRKETRFLVGRAIETRRHSITIVMWDEDHD